MSTAKVYVGVNARFEPDGRMLPLSVTWEDGREYEVDRVLNVCRAASLKAGGVGMRYTVRIGGKETYIFFEEDKYLITTLNFILFLYYNTNCSIQLKQDNKRSAEYDGRLFKQKKHQKI
jgi:hypothetical protein